MAAFMLRTGPERKTQDLRELAALQSTRSGVHGYWFVGRTATNRSARQRAVIKYSPASSDARQSGLQHDGHEARPYVHASLLRAENVPFCRVCDAVVARWTVLEAEVDAKGLVEFGDQ
jgi:hypothetical protein